MWSPPPRCDFYSHFSPFRWSFSDILSKQQEQQPEWAESKGPKAGLQRPMSTTKQAGVIEHVCVELLLLNTSLQHDIAAWSFAHAAEEDGFRGTLSAALGRFIRKRTDERPSRRRLAASQVARSGGCEEVEGMFSIGLVARPTLRS